MGANMVFRGGVVSDVLLTFLLELKLEFDELGK